MLSHLQADDANVNYVDNDIIISMVLLFSSKQIKDESCINSQAMRQYQKYIALYCIINTYTLIYKPVQET